MATGRKRCTVKLLGDLRPELKTRTKVEMETRMSDFKPSFLQASPCLVSVLIMTINGHSVDTYYLGAIPFGMELWL